MKIEELNTIIHNEFTDIYLDDCAAIYGGHGRPLIWKENGAWCRRMIGGGTMCREPGVD